MATNLHVDVYVDAYVYVCAYVDMHGHVDGHEPAGHEGKVGLGDQEEDDGDQAVGVDEGEADEEPEHEELAEVGDAQPERRRKPLACAAASGEGRFQSARSLALVRRLLSGVV